MGALPHLLPHSPRGDPRRLREPLRPKRARPSQQQQHREQQQQQQPCCSHPLPLRRPQLSA
jgi:hypothetical protein